MFLKSVDILGFKSFADKTHLKFSRGITALMGPNGCGKSNVLDAVKWVLGEQSYKSLRAARMEDILFSGTEARKPLNVAEVTLVLSNEEEQLPLAVPEISIKRRFYRSAESDYFINNSPALLKEIRELFFDTGIGKSAYSIMEQGKIEQILSTRPEDRRLVFEEAAGITKYRIKGADAERKLEKTGQNIRQVEVIRGEVKRSRDILKKQAERTERYRNLQERIFSYELDIQLLRLRAFLEQKKRIEERINNKTDERTALKQEIDLIKETMEQQIDFVNSMESRLVENQNKLYRIDLEKRNKESQIKILREQIIELERKITSDEERRQLIGDKIIKDHEELRDRTAELEELKAQLEDVEANIQGFKRDIGQFEGRVRENEKEILRLQQESDALECEINTQRVKLRRITDDIVTQLDRRLKELGYSAHARQEAEREFNSLIESIKIQLTGKSNILRDLDRVGDVSESGEESVLASMQSVLEEVLEKIDQLNGLFAEYKRFTPSFLEEFLAPEGIMSQKRAIDQRIADIQDQILSKRSRAGGLQTESKTLGGKIAEYRQTLESLRVNQARMNTQKAGLENELRRLKNEISEREAQLKEIAGEIEISRQRLDEIDSRINLIALERSSLEGEEKSINKEVSSLEREIAQKNETLLAQEQALKRKREMLEGAHVVFEKLQMDQAEIKAEIRNLYENFNELHSHDLSEYENRMFQIATPLKNLKIQLSTIKDELKKLGQVNLMAPEEFAEVDERYQFLSGQLEDLEKASFDLQLITKEIRSESTEIFLECYNKIRKNFHMIFRRLFGGGRAELKLTDPSNVLESGIEIFAQPPGKKLENITLLSGGEKSMTAIALLFATYMVKPSPFCILDEIDATLDEQNVIHFVNLLKDFSGSSQFIVITHNKKTVASADTLLGVTMEESGVTKIVSLKLEKKFEEKSSA